MTRRSHPLGALLTEELRRSTSLAASSTAGEMTRRTLAAGLAVVAVILSTVLAVWAFTDGSPGVGLLWLAFATVFALAAVLNVRYAGGK